MSKKEKNNYSEEFKKSSSELVISANKLISQTAKDLVVNANTLYTWVDRYHPNKKNDTNSKLEVGVYEELKQLKKQNAQLRQERDILKKATAYFARETL